MDGELARSPVVLLGSDGTDQEAHGRMPATPLRSLHESLGARFTTFGEWEMPLQYEGVIAEHRAVRAHVGVFDVTHLGRMIVEGRGATELLRGQLCNDVAAIGPGRAQYTMALNDRGGVEDDIIVWRFEDERYWVLPNGANFHEIVGRFIEAAPATVRIDPVRDDTVLLAVQGPDAPAVLERVLGTAPKRFRVIELDRDGIEVKAAGTGYTGERGAEIAVSNGAGEDLMRELVQAGAVPCGLGARDTLRLEMGYPLWGQDLDATTTPLEADLAWVVAWGHEFVGRDALEEQRRTGPAKRLIGFRTDGRAIPRHGYALRSEVSSGTVSSGNFSPVLECGIGMGYLSPAADVEHVEVEIRGEWHAATAVKPPFIEK